MKSKDIERAVLVQYDQLNKINDRMNELNSIYSSARRKEELNIEKISDLDKEVDLLFKEIGIDRQSLDLSEEKEYVALSTEELYSVNQKHKDLQPLPVVEFTDFRSYMAEVDTYINKYKLDLTRDPIIQMLPPGEINKVIKDYDIQFSNLKWDKWDYGIVGVSAIIAVLLDFFVVRIPRTESFLGVEYKGSPLTKFFNDQSEKILNPGENTFYSWLNDGYKQIEEYAKVPYDVSRNSKDINVDGLTPHFHRLMSLGHDPLLGFIFGTIDILRGTMTTIDKHGVLRVMDVGEGSFNMIEALLKVAAHLISDVCTRAGIQPPFFSLLQLISGKSSFILRENGEQVSYTNVARYMYKHGYDFRHFLTMSIVPMIIELIIRVYYKIANFERLYNGRMGFKDKYKLSSMLTLSHSLAMSGNFIKMWCYGWNPVSFNWAEMLALFRSFYSLYKAKIEKQKAIDNQLLINWEAIYNNTLQPLY